MFSNIQAVVSYLAKSTMRFIPFKGLGAWLVSTPACQSSGPGSIPAVVKVGRFAEIDFSALKVDRIALRKAGPS